MRDKVSQVVSGYETSARVEVCAHLDGPRRAVTQGSGEEVKVW